MNTHEWGDIIEAHRSFRKKNLTNSQTKALNSYINSCTLLNKSLMNGLSLYNARHRAAYPDICTRIALMDSVFNDPKLRTMNETFSDKHSLITYRGINSDTVRKHFMEVKTLEHKHFVSTSTHIRAAHAFSADTGVIFKVHLDPKEVNFMFIHKNEKTMEMEVLLEREVTFILNEMEPTEFYQSVPIYPVRAVKMKKNPNAQTRPSSPLSNSSCMSCSLSDDDIEAEKDVLFELGDELQGEALAQALTEGFVAQFNNPDLYDTIKQQVDAYLARKQGGQKQTTRYNGRNYKIRTGPRGGQYIIVKGRHVYGF